MAFQSGSSRSEAIASARQVLQNDLVYLDTETTGLGPKDEIVEIALVDKDGNTLLDSFVKPGHPIPPDAFQIHGITNDMVQKSPAWPILWTTRVKTLLSGRIVVAYNAEFDLRMMKQSYEINMSRPWTENIRSFDLLKVYSLFRGVWDPQRRAYKYFSLDEAGKSSGISLPNAHRAVADTLLARALLIYIAGVNP